MAWGNFVLDKGFSPNGTDIHKFRAVKLVDVEEVGPIAANTDDFVGFAQFDDLAADQARGKDVSVRVMGVTEAEAVGAIGVGAWVTLEADGRVSALANGSGKTICGKCVGSPSTNAGDRIALLILPQRAKA